MKIATLVVVVSSIVAADTATFHEDFESGFDGWSFTDEKAWAIEERDGNHVLALTKSSHYMPVVRSPQSIAWREDETFGSFQLDVTMRQTGRDYEHRDLCLFFGKQDASHYYYVHIATQADPRAHSIFIVNGKPRASIATERTDGVDWGDGPHNIRIRRDIDSGTIEVYFDDMETPIMRATDTTFGSGSIGLGSFDDVGELDDLTVEPLPK